MRQRRSRSEPPSDLIVTKISVRVDRNRGSTQPCLGALSVYLGAEVLAVVFSMLIGAEKCRPTTFVAECPRRWPTVSYADMRSRCSAPATGTSIFAARAAQRFSFGR